MAARGAGTPPEHTVHDRRLARRCLRVDGDPPEHHAVPCGGPHRLLHSDHQPLGDDRPVFRVKGCLFPDRIGASITAEGRPGSTACACLFARIRTGNARHGWVSSLVFGGCSREVWARPSRTKAALVDRKGMSFHADSRCPMRGMGLSVTSKGCPRRAQGHVLSACFAMPDARHRRSLWHPRDPPVDGMGHAFAP